MSIFDITFTLDDVVATNWQQCLETEVKECGEYSTNLRSKASEALAASQETKHVIFTILSYIFSLQLNLDEKNNPFSLSHYGAHFTLDVLHPMHFNVFKELLPTISDPEALARIKDILWVKREISYQIGVTAIDDYLASAERLEDPNHWPPFVSRVERAMQLAATFRNAEAFDKLREYIIRVLEKYNGDDPYYMSEQLMQFLTRFTESRSAEVVSQWSSFSERIAVRCEQQNDWRRARDYWTLKAQWHGLISDQEERLDALIKAAETWNREADFNSTTFKDGFSSATGLLIHGVEAFRRIDSDETLPRRDEIKNRIVELRQKLSEFQLKANGELQQFRDSINIRDAVIEAQQIVKGKNLVDALLALAFNFIIPIQKSKLRQQVEDTMKNSIFMAFHAHTLDSFGRIIATRPGTLSDSQQEKEASVIAETFKMAAWHQDAYGSVINAAIEQISLEHNIAWRELLPLVTNHPFVPPGREQIYAQGLYYGLAGDMLIAMHLLIPQLENSIRYMLRQHRIIVSGLDASSGVEEDFDINRLLYMQELNSVIGFSEDIIFNLRGLLVERFGSNIRNSLAHGQFSYGHFFSSRMSYLWWLILHICCIPIAVTQMKTEKSDLETDNNVEVDPNKGENLTNHSEGS